MALARLAGRAPPRTRRSRVSAVLRRALDDAREVVGQRVDLDLVELARDAVEHVAQAVGLEEPDQQVAAAHLRVPEHEGAVHPAALHRVLDVLGEVRDGRGAARQPVERGVRSRDSRAASSWKWRTMRCRSLSGSLQDLGEPVHELDVRVAAQLAERTAPSTALYIRGLSLPNSVARLISVMLFLFRLPARTGAVRESCRALSAPGRQVVGIVVARAGRRATSSTRAALRGRAGCPGTSSRRSTSRTSQASSKPM